MPTRITQEEITTLTKEEENLKALRKKAKDLEAKIANIKHEFMSLLDKGAKVEKGRYTLAIEEKDGRVTPAWKDLYIDHQVKAHNIAPELAEAEARKLYPAEKQRTLVVGISNV
jgi:DNA helicase IV